MKKNLLFIAIIFSQVIAFSQVKHITFTDSIILNTAASLDYFKVAESANNDGYFLATRYDDQTSLMKHYVAKTDFENTIVWDTVYYFQEPFSTYNLGISSVISADNEFTIATAAVGTNNNGRAQPFLYNLDNNGGINWNKYYEIDTLEFDQTNVLKTNDGGYMLFGRVSDYSEFALSNQYGYVYKLDPSGSLEWSKLYADKDTAEFSFNAGDLTMDDKYILAGNSANQKMGGGKISPPTAWDNFMNVVCLGLNGDVLWNSALFFDAPVQNDNSFNVASVNVGDNDIALVSFTYYDSTLYYNNYGLASINIIDGSVNWVNSYSIASEFTDFSLRKVVRKKDGNLVVFFDDYSNDAKSDLLELDVQGNIIQSKTIQEFVGSTTFYQDIVATEDGGLYINANISTGKGLLTFKTDKNLNTYCPEESMFITPTTGTLQFDVYSIVDTVIDVMPVEASLTPMTEIEITGNSYEFCSCELTIGGVISIPGAGTPADSVKVVLYKFDPNPGQYVKHDSILTDILGNYAFNYLPEGNYIIRAKPLASKYPNLLPTYGAFPSVTQWDSAYVTMVSCGGNGIITINFDLVQKLPQTGSWACNGYVFEYFGYNPTNKKAPGEPLGDIDITVEQSPGGAISSATTDVNGYYEFTGLDNNATFIVRADIPGLPNDSIYTFTVNPGDGALDSLNFYVDSVGVYILLEDIFTSVKSNENSNLSYNILPNPTKELVNLVVETTDEINVEVVITNLVGELIYTNNYNVSSGITKYPIDLTNYTQGIYFIRINQDNDYIVKKIIKQ